MEYVELLTVIEYSTPVLLFGLIISSVYQIFTTNQLRKEVTDLKQSITWSDTCDERHARIDTRLNKIESKVFNGGSN